MNFIEKTTTLSKTSEKYRKMMTRETTVRDPPPHDDEQKSWGGVTRPPPGIVTRELTGSGAKPSHHRLQHLSETPPCVPLHHLNGDRGLTRQSSDDVGVE